MVTRFSLFADRPQFSRSFAQRLVMGAISGALLALALPKPNLYYLGWIALIPLMLALEVGHTRRQTFWVGYAAGLTFFAGTCYWIVSTMNTYGGLGILISSLVFALFVTVFAAHGALWALLMRVCLGRWGHAGLLLAAPAWVAVELLQTHLIFGGFPWMLVGYALVPFGGLLQIVTWTGVYGLSWVLVGVNSLLAFAILSRNWRPALGAGLAVILVVVIPAPVGEALSEDDASLLPVRIVQTLIPIDQPWGGVEQERLLDELAILSKSGEGAPRLVVWPETPSPFYLSRDPDFLEHIGAIARDLEAHLLVGYIDFVGDMPSNSAGLVSPSGVQVSRYDKIHLVPFGEYVPLGKLLFFAESMVRNVGDFASGTEYTISDLDGHRVATTICFEDVFPNLMRQFTLRGAELILNITNDGWFGSSSAPYQHLRMSVVRAVENRRYLVRAANTGISAIIDPYGRVVVRTQLGERTSLDGVVAYRSDQTIYVRYGDVFAYTSAGGVLLLLLFVLWKARA